MDTKPAHFVAIVGGAVAGSVAAEMLAQNGIKVAVFEQSARPYGKIEDGLPKWHLKLRLQEEKKIDSRLDHPNVFFVPNTRLGRDLGFHELLRWGFSAILLANGAWRDRPLPLPGIDRFVGSGLVYQNELVRWFNHYHEPDYAGPQHHIPDGAIIVGGGLASLDVVKIVMLETTARALREHGVNIDVVELEHASIRDVLARHKLTLAALGLRGCTLYYRRRLEDMPLAPMPAEASAERRKNVFQARRKILRNFQAKFLFQVQPCRAPTGVLEEGGRLAGLVFSQTRVEEGRVHILPGTETPVPAPLVVSSIGSLPEPIPGLAMKGDLYDLRDPATGQLNGFENVFALGNVVTGEKAISKRPSNTAVRWPAM